MTEIVFGGVVSSGIGHHATLYVPGRAELRNAPADWPERLHPGSLNVSVDQYPPEFMNRGLRNSVSELDLGRFVPEFEILRDQFQNNKIEPRPDLPRGRRCPGVANPVAARWCRSSHQVLDTPSIGLTSRRAARVRGGPPTSRFRS
jgi:hypothetical protein